jgi:hypothetical protein
MKAYDAKQAEYVKAKADYDKEQAVYAAAMKTFKASQSAYASAKASYDKAVKAGKKDGVAPVAPQTPTAPAMQVPMAPGEAPMALVAPKAPAPPRDYGIASLTYPVKLTKVILGAPPSLLYVTDEVPVKSRVIYMDQVGVLYENGDKSGAM